MKENCESFPRVSFGSPKRRMISFREVIEKLNESLKEGGFIL